MLHHLWPTWLCRIVRTHLVNGTTFAKLLFDRKCVFFFIFSKTWYENFLITRRIQRDIVTGVNRSLCALYLCPILNKLEFYRHILTKIPNREFHCKYSIGRGVLPRKVTDGQTFMTLLVTFRNFANAPKSTILTAVSCGCTN
jgi:hypothetical protein